MKNKLLIGLVVLAAGVAVGWYWFSGGLPKLPSMLTSQSTNQPTSQPTVDLSEQESKPGSLPAGGTPMEKGGVTSRTVITYTDTGFAPATVTVVLGSIVTFVNESSHDMWVASDTHPTHQLLPGFDQLASVGKGGTYEYAFVKAGTWRYHNHANATDIGTVVVVK